MPEVSAKVDDMAGPAIGLFTDIVSTSATAIMAFYTVLLARHNQSLREIAKGNQEAERASRRRRVRAVQSRCAYQLSTAEAVFRDGLSQPARLAWQSGFHAWPMPNVADIFEAYDTPEAERIMRAVWAIDEALRTIQSMTEAMGGLDDGEAGKRALDVLESQVRHIAKRVLERITEARLEDFVPSPREESTRES